MGGKIKQHFSLIYHGSNNMQVQIFTEYFLNLQEYGVILFFFKNLFQKSFNTCWFYRLLQENIFGLFYYFSEKVLKVY